MLIVLSVFFLFKWLDDLLARATVEVELEMFAKGTRFPVLEDWGLLLRLSAMIAGGFLSKCGMTRLQRIMIFFETKNEYYTHSFYITIMYFEIGSRRRIGDGIIRAYKQYLKK